MIFKMFGLLVQRQFVITCLLMILVAETGGRAQGAKGGPCYSQAQTTCADVWSKLWSARNSKQYGDVCRKFGDVHSCIKKYMSHCKFQQHEADLYKTDIVDIFTQEPYSCHLIGGNLEFKGSYQGSTGTAISHKSSTGILLIYLLFVLFCNLYLTR